MRAHTFSLARRQKHWPDFTLGAQLHFGISADLVIKKFVTTTAYVFNGVQGGNPDLKLKVR
jgi:hypothetical protein